MPQVALPSDWLSRFSDSYAVMGIPLTADDRRITKRLRAISKGLHPDLQPDGELKELATLMLSKIVNPAYERLKQEKGRNEIKALLRLQVRKLNRDETWRPNSDIARKLLQHPASNIEVFYEQAVSNLADIQYVPLTIVDFEAITEQLVELNLAYLQLTMGEGFYRSERRTGVVPAATAVPPRFTPAAPAAVQQESYDRRHYRRANQHMKREEWDVAVQELREAIKIKANEPDYHALLGVAYYHQKLNGMAKVYLGQALKLKPDHTLALKYAERLGIAATTTPSPPLNGLKNGSRNGAQNGAQNGKAIAPDRSSDRPSTWSNPADSGRTPGAKLSPQGQSSAPAPRRSVSYVSSAKQKPTGLMGWLRGLFE